MTALQQINDAELSRLASEVILLFPRGMEFTAEGVMAAFPHLAESRRSYFKLTLEEYLRRVDNREALDVEEFLGRHPEIEDSLRREINLHSALMRDPQQLEQLLAPRWPVPDSEFLDWRIRRLIGRGGFSRVYLADEPKIGHRPVALKITTRSGRECELVGRLSHAGICQILSVRDDDPSGFTAIAMPFHGEATLHDLIDKTWKGESTSGTHDLPDWGVGTSAQFVDHVIGMAVRLCEALEYAHANHVLHCDLKPSNILIKDDGSPLLLDFNLAFSMQDGSGVIGGTVGYMAPEQVRATLNRAEPIEVDARADVYGLGAVLYHTLCGSTAYAIDMTSNVEARLEAVLNTAMATSPIALHERNEAVAAEISELIERCLDSDPLRRPSSMTEVREALEKALSRTQRSRAIARNRPISARVLLSIAAVTAVAALAVTLALNRPDPVPISSNQSRPAASFNNVSIDIDQEIERLESIPADEITPAERELLGYYYCLDEQWGSARDVLTALIDENRVNAAICHNLAYAVSRLSGYGDACRHLQDALRIDSTQGKSWAALVYYETFDAMNHGREPNQHYLEQATIHCDDAQLIELLSRLVDCVSMHPDLNQQGIDDKRALILDEIQPIVIAMAELPSARWLIAPANLPAGAIGNQLVSN